MEQIRLSDYKNIIVLTGAGVSVASGLGTYRGKTAISLGKHKRPPTSYLFERDPLQVIQIFAERKRIILNSSPNPSHYSLAEAEKLHKGKFTVITQNVDGFHQKAGSESVIEMHGNLLKSRCSNPSCELPLYDDVTIASDTLHLCSICDSPLRPDIVLFGENIKLTIEELDALFFECDLFISAGTSGTVYPAASFVEKALIQNAQTIYTNLEPIENDASLFDHHLIGKTEEILPSLFIA